MHLNSSPTANFFSHYAPEKLPYAIERASHPTSRSSMRRISILTNALQVT
jgi:hypothetical protein